MYGECKLKYPSLGSLVFHTGMTNELASSYTALELHWKTKTYV